MGDIDTAYARRCRPRLDQELAAQQKGLLKRRQLLAAGIPESTIDTCVATRRYVIVYSGVYCLGHDRLTDDGFSLAAVYAGGPGAALSHRSAAAHWGFADHRGLPHVSVPRSRRWRSAEIVIHRPRLLDAEDITELRGVPVTTVARTLIDLAGTVRVRELKKLIHEAEVERVLDRGAVLQSIERAPGRRGVRFLRALMAVDTPPTKNEFERRFRELIEKSGLPPAKTNVRLTVGGIEPEVDALWERQRLAVELDGYRAHGTQQAFERDRSRDLALTTAGYRTVRVTWTKLRDEPTVVADALRKLIVGDITSQ